MNEPMPPVSLGQLRRQRRISQGALEKRGRISQSAILNTERAHDPRLSTVTRFVDALGGRLHLVASFDDGDYNLSFPLESSPTTSTEQTPVWRIRAWDDPRLAERFRDEGVVAVSEDEIGQAVTGFDSDKALRQSLQEKFPKRSENAIGTFVTYWRYFSRDMTVGDTIVLAYRDRRGTLKAAVGAVAGEYEYLANEADERLRHRRAVHWQADLDRSELDDDLRRTVDAPGTISRFGAADAGTRLAALTTTRPE